MEADLEDKQIVFLRISPSMAIWVYLKLKLDKKTNKKSKFCETGALVLGHYKPKEAFTLWILQL